MDNVISFFRLDRQAFNKPFSNRIFSILFSFEQNIKLDLRLSWGAAYSWPVY